jgi:hypothetical protein
MGFLNFLSPKKKREEKKQKLIEATNVFLAKLKEQRGLTPITTSILLKKGEDAYFQTETILRETRAVRKFTSGGEGVGFRVMKGVYVGVGGRNGTSESHEEWRNIDEGQLTLTNKRLIFDGAKENRVIPLEKIISVNPWLDAIEVSAENRKKSMLFSVENPYIWATVIHILIKAEDPRKIDNVDITFQ